MGAIVRRKTDVDGLPAFLIVVRRTLKRCHRLLPVIALLSCADAVTPDMSAAPFLDHGKLQPVGLRSERFDVGYMVGYIGDVAFVGHQIWLVDYSGDPYFHVLDSATHQVTVSRGRRGSGPGEFRALRGIFPAGPNSAGVWGYDGQARRLIRIGEDGEPSREGMITMTSGDGVLRLARADNEWIAWSMSADTSKRYAFLDDTGATIAYAPGPLLGDSTISFRQRLQASATNSLCARHTGDGFAVVYFSAGRVEIRGRRGELMSLADVPFPSNGTFRRSADGELRWHLPRLHYVRCAATDNLLFALFSGAADPPVAPGGSVRPSINARFVHVFGWDGRLVAVLELDQYLTSLSISPDGRWLYGGGQDDAALYRFEIPVHMRSGIL